MRRHMARGGRYYPPEDLGPPQDRRDDADPGRRFYVYVLDTDYGHYIGHTWHVGRRLRQHQEGETPSTAGGNPTLAWESGPFPKRKAAASFEAELKGLRDGQHPAFRDYTGLRPRPFANPSVSTRGRTHRRSSYQRRRYGRRRRSGLGRLLAREIHGLFRSRRKRRMWGAVAVGVVLVVVYLNNGGF